MRQRVRQLAGGADLPPGVRPERIEPLWTRVDRNRVTFVLFIAGYLLSIAASAAVMATALGYGVGLLVMSRASSWEYLADIPTFVLAVTVTAAVAGAIWMTFALMRSEKVLLKRFGAQLTPTGAYMPTKLALKDMAIASGFPHAPPLWVIPDCDRVNALAIGRGHRTAIVAVTQGFVDRLSTDEQRAVFANLMARLRSGDVRLATAISSLVGPIWRMRDADLRRDYTRDETDDIAAEAELSVTRAGWGAGAGAGMLAIFLYAFLIVLTEVLLAGHQRSTMLTAEKADAEGMLLLKDPRSMLRALEHVLECDNTVSKAGETYSNLFYCWAGFGYAPEDDPEFERVARLREVLGAEGLAVDPSVAARFDPLGLLAPVPPRIQEAERPHE